MSPVASSVATASAYASSTATFGLALVSAKSERSRSPVADAALTSRGNRSSGLSAKVCSAVGSVTWTGPATRRAFATRKLLFVAGAASAARRTCASSVVPAVSSSVPTVTAVVTSAVLRSPAPFSLSITSVPGKTVSPSRSAAQR